MRTIRWGRGPRGAAARQDMPAEPAAADRQPTREPHAAPAREPTMEEILASIRRIIGEGGDGDQAHIATMAELGTFLAGRDFVSPESYGIFQRDAAMLRFRDDPRGETLLADIRAANRRDGLGNVKLPGTSVELINYSYCPRCQAVHSMLDLERYYFAPRRDPRVSLAEQHRKDRRVACKDCGALFLPALIVVDGTPKGEMPLLCRVQVVDAIEQYCAEAHRRPVLSRNPAARRRRVDPATGATLQAVANDVDIGLLRPRPALIANFLQYSPPDLAISFAAGRNIANDDVVYGAWFA